LSNFDEETEKSYAQTIENLYNILRQNGSKCFMIENRGDIIGFAIFYPDGTGGVIGQSLFLKKEYRKNIFFGRIMSILEKWVSLEFDYCKIFFTNNTIPSIYEKRNDKRYKKQYTVYKFTPKD